MRTPCAILGTLFAVLLSAVGAHAQYGRAPRHGEVGPDTEHFLVIDQKINQPAPLDVTFYDHDAKPVTLRQLMNGKPTIVVPAYYRCPKLCNEILNHLLSVLRKMREDDPKFTAGDAFNVITFTVDAREAPALAHTKRVHYLREYDGRDPTTPGWWFLSATQGQGFDPRQAELNIHDATEALGFPFVLKYRGIEYQFRVHPTTGEKNWLSKDNKVAPANRNSAGNTDDIFHATAVILLKPDGTIFRYFVNKSFTASTMRRSLVEASGGQLGTKTDEMALLCSVYDQETGNYKLTTRALAIVAFPFLLLVVGIAVYTIRRIRRDAAQPLPVLPQSSAGTDSST